MNEITVTNELEIRVERVFDASRAGAFPPSGRIHS
jgi:hypothetical protein